MNKVELIAAVAEKSGLTKKDSEKAVIAFVETVEQALKDNEKVQLVGFGTFEATTRAAHMGRNPRTKEPMQIPESKTPRFRAGKALKDNIK